MDSGGEGNAFGFPTEIVGDGDGESHPLGTPHHS